MMRYLVCVMALSSEPREAVRARRYPVGAIALLALAFTSLGSAAGLPSTDDRNSSGASRVTSTASGQCSKAEAIEAVKRLGLRDASPTYPVYKVLCGAFAGAGSSVMVASISGSGNVGMIYWAVFRWSGGGWRLLMKRHQAAILTAAGSSIRETVSIYRVGDPRCCASGGTKTRIWHWNGSRFTAAPWRQATPAQPRAALHMPYFKSPTGNISCSLGDSGTAYCRTWNPPQSVSMDYDGSARMCTGSRRCTGPCSPINPPAGCSADTSVVLGYGQRNEYAGYRCTSASTGMTCTVMRGAGRGKGFRINRDGITRVGG